MFEFNEKGTFRYRTFLGFMEQTNVIYIASLLFTASFISSGL
jgi:hypothetical protein